MCGHANMLAGLLSTAHGFTGLADEIKKIEMTHPRSKILTVLGILLAFLYVLFLNPYPDINKINAHDPAEYLNRALAIWQGLGYGVGFAGEFLPVTVQPPGFSLILAPVVGLFDFNFVVLKSFMVLWAFLFAGVLYVFFKHYLSDKNTAFAASLLLAASPVTFALSHIMMVEIPLFTFICLALLSFDRYMKQDKVICAWLFTAALAAGAAFYFKETALGVLGGVWLLIFHPAFRNKKQLAKMFLFTAVFFATVAPWLAWRAQIPDVWYWTHSHSMDFMYKDPTAAAGEKLALLDILTRARHNLVWGMLGNLALVLIAPFYFFQGSFAVFLISIPIAIGIGYVGLRSFLKQPSVLEGFVLLSLAVLLIKDQGPAFRFLAIVYPALGVYAFRGLAIFPALFRNSIVTLLILAAIASSTLWAFEQYQNPYGSQIRRDYAAVAQKAKELFPAGTVCLAPSAANWQMLTHHLSYRKEKLIDENRVPENIVYYVTFSNSPERFTGTLMPTDKYFTGDTREISDLMTAYNSQAQTLYQNSTFTIRTLRR